MHDTHPAEGHRRSRKLLTAAGLLAAGAVAGGVLASNLTASADDNNSSGSSAPPSSTSQRPPAGKAGGATPVRSGEKALTGSDADKARAAALDAVPGGTVYRVETDADGDAYEAHMTKSDGSLVTVKLDEEFTVTGVEEGMGSGGGPAPDGSHGPGSGSGSPAPR